ncbi:unnamed protein product, partial [marine sediment metagenome]
DADIAGRLPQASGRTRQVLVELVGRRRIEAALPALVRSASDADAGVRGAAVAAIGAIGSAEHLPDLVKVLATTQDRKERAGVEKALVAISSRGGAACAQPLMPLAKSGDGALRAIALHALAAAGGTDALAAVKAALGDKDQAVQHEAVRTLSTWPNKWSEDDGVVEPLLALVKSSTKLQHQVLGLRGYLQYLHGTKKLGDADKQARLNDVLPLIKRPEEKRLAISVLGTVRTAAALDRLVAYAGEAVVAEEACTAIVGLAGRRDLKGAS